MKRCFRVEWVGISIVKVICDWECFINDGYLLTGGGYSEYVVVNQGSVMPITSDMSFVQAAGVAEVFLTAYQALVVLGNLKPNESVLIHAGASGVGTAAIQLASAIGAKVFVTAGTDEKLEFCKGLGADLGINYKTHAHFDELVLAETDGRGADLIIDFVGADYMTRNIHTAAVDGRIVMLAFMSGARADGVNLAQLLMKRLTFMGSTLRARSDSYKKDLVRRFTDDFYRSLESGKIKPIIDSVYPWDKVGAAHQRIEQNLNTGKIILELGLNS